jgi:hypothetical protein
MQLAVRRLSALVVPLTTLTGWIGRPSVHRPDAVPWKAVVRIKGDRIVVRDGTELV